MLQERLSVTFLLVLSCLSGWSQSRLSDSLYAAGVQLYHQGRYDEALPLFLQSDSLDKAELDSLSPRRGYSAQWASSCYYKMGRESMAQQYDRRQYKLKPVDRRQTVHSDSLIEEAIHDLVSNRCSMALEEAKEACKAEHALFDSNHYFHIGTQRLLVQSNFCLQQLDSALVHLEESTRLIKVNFGEMDTLLLSDLNPMYYIYLNQHRLVEAEQVNNQTAEILSANYDDRHPGYAEVAYRNITLMLHQRQWQQASNKLPEYIATLKRCFNGNTEMLRGTFNTIRNDFSNCGRTDDVVFLDSVIASEMRTVSPHDFINVQILQYTNRVQAKDFGRADQIERELTEMLTALPDDSLQEQRAVLSCMKCVSLMASGRTDEAKDAFLQIQRDSLELLLGPSTMYYPAYLGAKAAISAGLLDMEGGIDACTKLLAIVPVEQKVQNLHVVALLACMHAFAGNYQQARAITRETVERYDQQVVKNKAAFRLEKDTMQIAQVIRLVDKYIKNTGHLPDSAVYALRDVKSEYLKLKANILTNTPHYQLDYDYYECISDYALELVRMRKYIEAQEVMDGYLKAWSASYLELSKQKRTDDDELELLMGYLVYGEALNFRRKFCYEKGDPAGRKAYQDYIAYVKEENGEKSDEYLKAMVNYYEYIGDNRQLLNYLVSRIDAAPEDFSTYAYRLVADTYQAEKQPDLAMKYRKGYIRTALRDSTERVNNDYEILRALGQVIDYYTTEMKDTLVLLHYMGDELWPALDCCDVHYLEYFFRTADKLCFEIDDDVFIPFMEREAERRKEMFTNPAVRGIMYQTMAGILSRGSNKKLMAVRYMRQACREVEDDSVLHLLFSCRLHHVLCKIPDSSSVALQLGSHLIGFMSQKPEWKFTHEYAKLVERQLGLLQEAGKFEDVALICQTYLADFGKKSHNDLSNLLHSGHTLYEALSALNLLTLTDWSYDVSLPEVYKSLYTALLMKRSQQAKEYALDLVHNEYRHLNTSLNLNSVSTWRCDNLISLTSKLAVKHQTDSLKIYAYNTALLCKGLQLRSDHAIRAIIKQSGHKSALRKYDELQYTLHLLTAAPEEATDSLLKRKEELENDLFRLSEFFGDYRKSLFMSWKDVQRRLTDKDVAIEFTLVKKDYDDLYVRKDSTIQEGYYACVLRKGMMTPDVVFVARTDSISTTPDVYSSTTMTQRLLTSLQPYLKGITNIYFSPIGKLNHLSIEDLPMDNDLRKTISGKYNFYRLSSTRELVEDSLFVSGSNAIIYGGLAYDATVDDMQRDAVKHPEMQTRDVHVSEGLVDIEGMRSAITEIPYLAGTRTEAENVTTTINGNHNRQLTALLVVGTDGTETSFKALSGQQKRIVHIATHGYYFTERDAEKAQALLGRDSRDLRTEDGSMLRSGLFMAGAENRYQGKEIPSGIDDGILTAQEIANTDLSGLDLCVLSACQTAQGDVSSEGVFGLQRGFKKAGAKSILMSLWKVDDEATCLLMTEFYRNWIAKKMTKHDALEAAKHAVRSHKEKGWDNPQYWAAFILLDGLD